VPLWFRRRRRERQLDSELQFHLDRMAQEYIGRGIAPQEARRRARIEFGGAEQIKEERRGRAAAGRGGGARGMFTVAPRDANRPCRGAEIPVSE
jgi:hypothetical protein